MESVSALRFHDVPDYNLFKSIFPDPELSSPASVDDDEVILCLRMEKTPVVVASQMSKPSETSPKKRRVKKVAKRRGLRQRRGDTPEAEPEPEVTEEVDPNLEIEKAEREFESALAKVEKEHDYETMKNPTPAMVLQMERMKTRATLEHSESFSGRRKDG